MNLLILKEVRLLKQFVLGFQLLSSFSFQLLLLKSTNEVEATPKGYEDQEPLVIYASSSNWKWHFSYPEENIETVNYLYIPTDRPIEFKLYSYGPIYKFLDSTTWRTKIRDVGHGHTLYI